MFALDALAHGPRLGTFRRAAVLVGLGEASRPASP